MVTALDDPDHVVPDHVTAPIHDALLPKYKPWIVTAADDDVEAIADGQRAGATS